MRMTRRRFLHTAAVVTTGVSAGCAARDDSPDYDLLIYGATPAGIAAAWSAADDGLRVLLAEPTARIGGMVTSGLSHTDFRTFEALTGAFHTFRGRILAHYAAEYGKDSTRYHETFGGTHAEPKVNLQVFEEMIAERPSIEVVRNARLTGVETGLVSGNPRIASLELSGRGIVTAQVYLDGSYEGDLMAAAGVEYRVGREGRDEYDEPLAPETADGQLQGYNFRLIATRDPANRVAPKQPKGYQREMFVGVLPLLEDGSIEKVFGYPIRCLYKAHIPELPHGKYDVNDVSNGIVRLSLPGENLGWPDGDEAERRRIFQEHLLWNVGLLWFMQNDEAVPQRFREDAREWGWCADEFLETDHLPPQLYVREARRMTGAYVFTERDTDDASGDARARFQPDAIASGDYGPNCHGTAHEGSRFGGRHTGEFYKRIAPYQIPYGVLTPRAVTNLLVPTAASSSHVGFCALRLEPIWMSLGQAAGHAAALAVESGSAVQEVPAAAVRRRVWKEGGASIYVSDVPPEHADFEAVQWWGSLGGLHGLEPPQESRRGPNIRGQYFEAFPGHEAKLNVELTDDLRARWSEIASVDLPAGATRGDWIRQAWETKHGENS